MAIESRPGYPAIIHMGGNYAQPSASAAALPEGNTLDRALGWTGDRNCGAPVYDDDYKRRNESEYRKKFGDSAVDGMGTSTLDGVRRRHEVSKKSNGQQTTTRLKMLASLAHFAESD